MCVNTREVILILVRKVDTWLERCQSVVEEIQEKSEFFSDLILHKQKPFLTGLLFFEKKKVFGIYFVPNPVVRKKGKVTCQRKLF